MCKTYFFPSCVSQLAVSSDIGDFGWILLLSLYCCGLAHHSQVIMKLPICRLDWHCERQNAVVQSNKLQGNRDALINSR